MHEAIRIFRKDVRAIWPQVLLALVAAALPVFVRDAQHDDKLIGLLALTRWFLVVSAVHQEKLVGDREWWLTRPYSWKPLLGAKLLMIAAFMQAPLLLSDVAILVSDGLPISWTRLAMRQAQLALTLILPAAAVAAVTQGLVSFGIATLAILTAIFVPAANDTTLGQWGPLVWIPPTLVILILGGTAVLLLLWQYSRRQIVPAVGVLGGATIACSAVLLMPPTAWAIGIATHGSPPADGLRLEWIKDVRPSIASPKPGKIALTLPVRIDGLPDTMLAQPDLVRIDLRAPDGTNWNSGWQSAFLTLSRSNTDWWHLRDRRRVDLSFLLDQALTQPFRNQLAKCKLSAVITVLGPAQSRSLSPVNGKYVVPGFGVCTIEHEIMSYRPLSCLAGQPPAQEVSINESGYLYSGPGSWLSAISLVPSPVWNTRTILPHEWTGPEITFRMRKPIARIQRDLSGEIPTELFK
jgi:hypothetical protein